jgi:predicted transcriptional regulator of viral defense system
MQQRDHRPIAHILEGQGATVWEFDRTFHRGIVRPELPVLDNRAVFKRLGYIAQALGRDPNLAAACKDRISTGISALDPDGPQGGRRTMEWNLRINVRIAPQDPT